MDKKQGPTFIRVPQSVTYNTCFNCEYLNRHMRRSGRDPIYENHCTHPDIYSGTKRQLRAEGRYISQETPPITPHWCPFLQETEDFR